MVFDGKWKLRAGLLTSDEQGGTGKHQWERMSGATLRRRPGRIVRRLRGKAVSNAMRDRMICDRRSLRRIFADHSIRAAKARRARLL
jgi:hypothetical protein